MGLGALGTQVLLQKENRASKQQKIIWVLPFKFCIEAEKISR